MSESNVEPPPGAPAAMAGMITPRAVDGGQGWTWIAQAWGLFVKNPGIWIVNFILLMVVLLVLSVIPLLGHIASHLLQPVLIGGLMLGCRALDNGEPFEVAHLFAGFKTNTAQLVMVGVFTVIAGLIILAIVCLVLFVAGGGAVISALFGGHLAGMLAGGTFLLLGLAGLLATLLLAVPLIMAIWFAPPLVVFRNMQALDAMKSSFDASMKNIVPFLIYGLLTLVLCVVASIPLALGWLVLGPVLIASIYTGYRDIFPEP